MDNIMVHLTEYLPNFVHPFQIFSWSDYCINNDIMWKKWRKMDWVEKIMVWFLLNSQSKISPQFFDNAVLIQCMKFQKNLMTGCKDMGKKTSKIPLNGIFPVMTQQVCREKSLYYRPNTDHFFLKYRPNTDPCSP